MAYKKKIVVSVISDLVTDQRVIRISESLQAMGFDVSVIARELSDSLPTGQYSFTLKRLRCYFRRGVMQYLEFNLRLLVALLFVKTDYLLANDLDTLLPNYLVSRLRKKYLFYDTHEYFTGVPELKHSHLKRKMWKRLEDFILPKLKTIFTVNNSVKQAYESEYPVRLNVLRNMPVKGYVKPALMPAHWQGKKILLAQGAGFNEGRSCTELLDTILLLDQRFHLVFIGGGNQWEALKQKRKALSIEDRFDMLEKMPPAELKRYTLLAFLGFSLDNFEDTNCLFNLPNKVFDYLQAGVPVFATAIPEIKLIVEQYNCGICVTDTNPSALAKSITSIADNTCRYDQLVVNAKAAAEVLCWENESQLLQKIYNPFL